eukprot:CAMPEP_0183743364 /NCGR_PEP_ID=MMETSP0737-20130205/65179_1 /TAXON_ID=385413 /ORGANISM="Thalassiosira miniscula, Strain CCMP1093" /LENGTH=557 /DNA_ID=CAMNT_0025978983 /DNA_START=116 /DNA_END=1790 /DNA_ORIENTATION=-
MGGIIDLNATCPWELYLFAFIHLGAGIFMYLFDACLLTATSSCTDTERVIEKMGILCLLYVGVMFTILTYHNKNEPGKITTLSNFSAYGATALLVSVVFFGNASLGGIERSWMHMGDVLTMIILLAVLTLRVSKADAEWAEKKPLEKTKKTKEQSKELHYYYEQTTQTMGGIIDFNTTCPWELYLFALINFCAAIIYFVFDTCSLLTSTACSDTERVMESILALCFLYVGVMFTVLTYHNKNEPGKITNLSNFAAYGAMSLLVSIVFIGNASLGGIEPSWMHMGDVLSSIILLAVLIARVSKADAEWAEKKPLGNMGVNCKTLLLLILVIIALKFIAFTDFIDPLTFLADGAEMTDYAMCMWKFIAVLMIEIFLAILFSVLFDDDASHELVVLTVMVMSRVSKADAEWAEKKPLGNMGVNCKTLLLLILVLTAIKFLAYTDFIDPLKILADGDMTDYAMWMWNCIAVLIMEFFLAVLFSVLFDDDASHELVVLTVMVMSLVAAVMFYPAKKYFSSGMGLNGNAVWIRLSILVIVCILAIVGGRRGSPDRSGYHNVGS